MSAGVTWKKTCRCGANLNFSSEDILSGMPAEGCDYWCSNPDPEKAPHDWGVVAYDRKEDPPEPTLHGVAS